MKLTLSILLIVSFMALAAFGVMAMGHGQTHERIICIASAMQASGCPKEFTSAVYFGFHLNAFNSLFTAVFNSGAIDVIASLLAVAFTIGIALTFNQFVPLATAIFEQNHRRFAEAFVYPFNRPAMSWRALHENSPANFRA